MRRRLGFVACVTAAASTLLLCAFAQAASDGFVQQGAKLTARDEVKPASLGDTGGQFGHSVALSENGNTALIGGYADLGGVGAAWIFTRSGSSWKQEGKKLLPSGNVGLAAFGESVALSADGRTALIGGSKFGGGLGAAWVFVRSGSSWAQQSRLLSGDGGADAFGVSVALSGDGNIALVGASFYANRTGAAFLYRRTGATWKKLGKTLTPGQAISNPGYGTAVALSQDGRTAAVGGPIDGSGIHRLGAAWAYGITSSGWAQGKKLVASDAVQDGSFGESVSLSANGTSLLVGSNRGAAWIFARSGASWKQGAKLTAPVPAASMFGYSVALSASGTTAVVGAPYDKGGAGGSWSFSRSGTRWSQASRLASKGASGLVELGWGVGISGDGKTVLVGGPNDAHAVGAVWVHRQA